MAFALGHPGGPGRPPGKNKVREILDKMKVDPIIEMVKIAMNPETPDRMRFDIHRELAHYLHAKLKSVTITDSDGNSLMPQMIKVITPEKKDE